MRHIHTRVIFSFDCLHNDLIGLIYHKLSSTIVKGTKKKGPKYCISIGGHSSDRLIALYYFKKQSQLPGRKKGSNVSHDNFCAN